MSFEKLNAEMTNLEVLTGITIDSKQTFMLKYFGL